MPSHATLLDRMARSIAGEKVTPLNIPGGSLNYKFMDEFVIWNSSPNEVNRENLLKLFRDMRDIGHFTIKGGSGKIGYACEINCVGAHWGFSLSAWLGTMIWADKRGDKELFNLSNLAVLNEAIMCRYFSYNGQVCAPGARVKDEKGQTGLDRNKDSFLQLATGGRTARKQSYWDNVQNLPIKLMRDCIQLKLWMDEDAEIVRERAREDSLPRLPFPIHKRILLDSGYLAWIDKDDFTTKLLGRDVLSWVLTGPSAGPDKFKFGYDWEPLPEIL